MIDNALPGIDELVRLSINMPGILLFIHIK